MWIYPNKEQVVVQGADSTSIYNFASGVVDKTFCKKCGVLVGNKFKDLSQEQIDQLSEMAKGFYSRANHLHPVNLRAFDNFTLDELDIRLVPGDKFGVPYINP